MTLDGLRRCLAEELDITLDTPGRPTTSEPGRASRDPERWAALATYGHPLLEPELRRLAGPDEFGVDTGDEALVLRRLEGRAIAFRADRTPPQRVRTLADLADLGGAVAAGEATERARLELEAEVQKIRSQEQQVVAARRKRWEEQIRRRFRALVVQAIRAEQLLRRHSDGEAPDPRLVWLGLGQDVMSGWQHAELRRIIWPAVTLGVRW